MPVAGHGATPCTMLVAASARSPEAAERGGGLDFCTMGATLEGVPEVAGFPEAMAGAPTLNVSSPAVSVIIPTYQRAHVLGRAIDSVLAQSSADYELIVVDDGSTDGTREVVAAYSRRAGARSSRAITYLYQERRNVASARNLGIRWARGELIAFLDSDDRWHPQKLRRQLDMLRGTSLALVHTGRVLNTLPGNRRSVILPYPQTLARNSRHLLSGTANIAMTVMVRRSALARVGLFDEKLLTTQDLDLWLRIAREFELGLIDEPLVSSYKLPDSNMARNPERTYRDRICVMERLARDPHKDVNSGNWRRLAARHALRYADIQHRRGRHAAAGYWALRALCGFARATVSSRSRRVVSPPAMEHALGP